MDPQQAFLAGLRDAADRARAARAAAGAHAVRMAEEAPERGAEVVGGPAEGSPIYEALRALSPNLAYGYAQAKADLTDRDRVSWAGTAHEIRGVLAEMLRALAPDEKVMRQAWYRPEPNTSGPTQRQRARYILESRGAGSREREVAEQVSALDEIVTNLVRSLYSRASDAAHRSKERGEVARIIRYFEAFAADLLGLG